MLHRLLLNQSTFLKVKMTAEMQEIFAQMASLKLDLDEARSKGEDFSSLIERYKMLHAQYKNEQEKFKETYESKGRPISTS